MADRYTSKTVVLRKSIEEDEALALIDSKKTSVFKSLLKKPKKEDVHMHSLKLYYECILMVSGKYVADYYRKATHTITVDYNVRDVVFGDGVFTTKKKSSLKKAFAGKRGKNKIDLQLEEHVFVREEDGMVFNCHGQEIKIPYKINSDTVENYPKRILSKNKSNVKKLEITIDTALSKLQNLLKKPLESDVRDVTEEFTLDKITELYVPIFEARLIGPNQQVGILRLDAIRKKIL